MVFLDFEQPIADLHDNIENLRKIGKEQGIDMAKAIQELQVKLEKVKAEIYKELTPWQRVQLSRHPERPYTLHYIDMICESFTELHGDRYFGDDKAIVGGFGNIGEQSVLIVGHQKGTDTKSRQYRNFGMANPEGYRKAMRLMKLAEKFNKPIVCLIDTPGAYPGIEAEQRGQAQAIALNLFDMVQLKVPVVCYVIGEGASGGAIGIGVGDKVFMLENTWYSVISPESCSSILWRSWDYKEKAAEQLHLTPTDMYGFGIVDGIIKEPLGGAHNNPEKMAGLLRQHILSTLQELSALDTETLLEQRLDKFASIGDFVVQ